MELSFDEYIEQFKAQGFKLVKDTQEGETRSASLRFYTSEEYGEVTLKEKKGQNKISVMQSMNGKVVFTQ